MTTPQHPLGFGWLEKLALWRVQGYLPLENLREFALEISNLAGMKFYGGPDIRLFPTPAGEGGTGVQGYFCWVESWLIIGTWPEVGNDLAGRGLVRIAISTCQVDGFEAKKKKISKFIRATIGPIRKTTVVGW